MAKKKQSKKKADAKAEAQPDADDDAPHDDLTSDERFVGKSFTEIAEVSDDTVIPVSRIIHHAAAPAPKRRSPSPNIERKVEVIWGPLPEDPPPKPDRVATTLELEVMSPGRGRTKKVPSIGSMSPDFGKK